MEKEIINTKKAPAAIGPYSQAVKIENLVFTSGQIPIDPATGDFVHGDIKAQTEQSLKNIEAILAKANMDLSNAIKVNVFLKDMNDFVKVNEVYAKYFKEPFPARSCVQVAKLPKDASVEIEVIAKK